MFWEGHGFACLTSYCELQWGGGQFLCVSTVTGIKYQEDKIFFSLSQSAGKAWSGCEWQGSSHQGEGELGS